MHVVSKLHARGDAQMFWSNFGTGAEVDHKYDSWTAYGTSKLGLVHDAASLAERHGAPGLRAYSLHPGAVATGISGRGLENSPVLSQLHAVAAPLEKLVLLSPRKERAPRCTAPPTRTARSGTTGIATHRSGAAGWRHRRRGGIVGAHRGWLTWMSRMTIATGPVTQICWVTEDIAATEEYLSAHFEVGPWTRLPDIHFAPENCLLRGAARRLRRARLARLRRRGDAARGHPAGQRRLHLRRVPVDLRRACTTSASTSTTWTPPCDGAADAGVEVAQSGSMMGGEMRFAYLDGAHVGVPYIELAWLGPGMRAFYESLPR